MRLKAVLAGLLMCNGFLGCSSDDSDKGSEKPGFEGVCLGWERQFYDDTEYSNACREHFNQRATCQAVDGCGWLSDTYCSGIPKQCRTYEKSACATAPGCTWYAPPDCKDEADCNRVMYQDDGGCSGIPSSIIATCSGKALIDLSDLCDRPKPAPSTLDCSN
jgi:hypothetical protein